MSNFHIFEDPTTPDRQPASNPLPNPLNPTHTMHYCVCCLHEKANTEFSPDEFLLATPTPLRDATNEQNIGQENKRRKKNGPTCIACREKSKRKSQARRAKADEAKQLERVPWKEIVRMIEEGFDSVSSYLLTKSSLLPSEQLLLVSNFFQELSLDIVETNIPPTTKEERKVMAQYIVDQYGEAEGFRFQFNSEYPLSNQARGYPAQFAKAHCLRFNCSQQRRVHKASTLPYGRTRNRRAKERFDCKGEVKVSLFCELNLR